MYHVLVSMSIAHQDVIHRSLQAIHTFLKTLLLKGSGMPLPDSSVPVKRRDMGGASPIGAFGQW